ncbi:hypothetical protein PoB_002154000 [Plakobranchus ocellatus]|uniref:Uncharacterized protein n=1 Tax=Plakobranchus ocellatus TaxID=259542 RepID=A0AAV3ZKF9_9GAST|nr:hypothetical protein PoB_002154000 [Plakobranchus ocellatus]
MASLQPRTVHPLYGAIDSGPDDQMKNGLFAVCQKPARLCDIKSFQALHNPRLYSMTEWLLQYENARHRQDLYLDELRDLRQLFSTRKLHDTDESSKKTKRYWTPAWHPIEGYQKQSRLQRVAHPTSEACVLFSKDIVPKKRLIRRPEYWNGGYPSEVPLSSFQAVSRRLKDRHHGAPCNSRSSDRYINIPLERISRRNKLNLTTFLCNERARVSSQNSVDLSEVRVEATPIPCSR